MPTKLLAILAMPLFALLTPTAFAQTANTEQAAKRGLDPDKWFNNVEIVVAEQIGTETTTYVRNIYKYYVAYKLTIDAQQVADKARQQMAPAKS
jgi:membrane-bound lytic murein transglycosylase MltF